MVDAPLRSKEPVRVVLIGDDGTGKTSLFNALTGRPFDQVNSLHVSAQGKVEETIRKTPDGKTKLSDPIELVDTESHRHGGRGDAHRMNLHNYEGADVIVLTVPKWKPWHRRNLLRTYWMEIMDQRPGAAIFIAVTHSDEPEPETEPGENPPKPLDLESISKLKEIYSYIETAQVDYFQVSAKTGEGLNNLLEKAVRVGQVAQLGHLEAEKRKKEKDLEMDEKNALAQKEFRKRTKKECTLL